jgi:nitrate reductase NapE component
MKKDSTPEILEYLSTPRSRLTVQFFGLVNLVASIVGFVYLAVSSIFSLLVTKICTATGIADVLLSLYNTTVRPTMIKWTTIVYKDPTDTTPLAAFFFITLVVYPVLIWNVLASFKYDLATFFRSLIYASALVSYGFGLKFVGLHHLEAHASWVQGGIVKPEWRYIFDRFGEWWFSPLVGIAPGMPSYTHCLVHHKFNNNFEDPQSTLWFDRDSLYQFIFYYCPISLYSRHWGCGGVQKLHEYGQEKYSKAMQDGLTRMCIFYGILAMLNFKFFLIVCVPIAGAFTFSVSSLEWAMHAFLDMSNPACTPTLATTNLTTDGLAYRGEPWHIVHHALNTHFYSSEQKHTEKQMLDSYISQRENKSAPLYYFDFDRVYGKNNWSWGAIFSSLMKKDFKSLAECMIWTGEGERPSTEELIVFLKRSVEKVDITKYSMERLLEQQLVGPTDLKDKKIMKAVNKE